MTAISASALLLTGVVLFALVGGGAGLLFHGLRLRSEARSARAAADRLERLIASAPAAPMIVGQDGGIWMSRRLADWLGLVAEPRSLAELSGAMTGLSADDAATLMRDVAAAQRAGKPLERTVVPRGSDRTIMLHGRRSGTGDTGPGEVVVWGFDATGAEAEIARLRAEGDRLGVAFDALTGLIEAAPLPMWFRGPDLKLAMVNSAYVAAVEGRGAGDVIARGLELVEATGQGGPLAGAIAARDAAHPLMQVVPATVGGARRSLQIYDVPLTEGGIAGFAIDIEELEQARSGAKRFAEAQRAMLDRFSAGVAQFAGDRSLVYSNQPFRRMFAIRSEWLADRPEFDRVLERMREANRVPEVRDFPGWKAERRDWFLATEGAGEESWHLPGGAHIRVVAQPLPDGGLLLIFEDRTEQVQLASARDTLLRVRTATFDNLFEALAVFAADGRLQLWNNRLRRVWGFEEEFLAAHPRVDAFAAAAASRLSNPDRSVLIPELVRAATIERQQRGGRVSFADGRHFEFAAVPLPDGNALFTMIDITDSRTAEQALRDRNTALEDADRIKTQFVANMSYELRTPLTSISGFAEMLHGGYAGKLTKQADGYVEAILESVERLGHLVDDVLGLTREPQEGEMELSEVDLASIARAAAEAILPEAKRRAMEFVVEIGASTGRAMGNAERLRELIEHLLRHAVSGTPEGGRILLHTEGDEARARIVVSDNGPGMDADGVASAFVPFAGAGITPGGERALGLGLPLAKQFAEAHGGTIALDAEPGGGTLVTVDLPRR